jgi:hypothetical protein
MDPVSVSARLPSPDFAYFSVSRCQSSLMIGPGCPSRFVGVNKLALTFVWQ